MTGNVVQGQQHSTYRNDIATRIKGRKLDKNGAVQLHSLSDLGMKLLALGHRAVASELILGLLDANVETLGVVDDEATWFLCQHLHSCRTHL